MERRSFIGSFSAAAVQAGPAAMTIDPKPLFDISPYLYMQFMEPLGVTDASVEGAWDWGANDWRKDFAAVIKDLAPDVIRWGGLLSSYYRWREGVGPLASRVPMRNYVWGGRESNRVGTHEFIDLCRRSGAEPLWCINFLSDGKKEFAYREGQHRSGDAREAADWVSYCNDPDNKERRGHGHPQPYGVKLWQIGNETSYGQAGFSRQEAIARTVEFAKAMRARDPSIKLIGWGDRCGREGGALWAADMLKGAGEHIDYVAVHTMGAQAPRDPKSVLRSLAYQRHPEQAWEELGRLAERLELFIGEVEANVRSQAPDGKITVTEGHLSTMHNLSPILHEWLSGVYHARVMNVYQRHGAMVKMATGADFEGNRWSVNAVMFSAWSTWLMPVGAVMRLFKRVNGRQGVAVTAGPSELDVAASRTGDKIYLHVANTSYASSVETGFAVQGMKVSGGRVWEIAADDPREYVDMDRPDVFAPKEKPLASASWRFPARSVSAVELEVSAA